MDTGGGREGGRAVGSERKHLAVSQRPPGSGPDLNPPSPPLQPIHHHLFLLPAPALLPILPILPTLLLLPFITPIPPSLLTTTLAGRFIPVRSLLVLAKPAVPLGDLRQLAGSLGMDANLLEELSSVGETHTNIHREREMLIRWRSCLAWVRRAHTHTERDAILMEELSSLSTMRVKQSLTCPVSVHVRVYMFVCVCGGVGVFACTRMRGPVLRFPRSFLQFKSRSHGGARDRGSLRTP